MAKGCGCGMGRVSKPKKRKRSALGRVIAYPAKVGRSNCEYLIRYSGADNSVERFGTEGRAEKFAKSQIRAGNDSRVRVFQVCYKNAGGGVREKSRKLVFTCTAQGCSRKRGATRRVVGRHKQRTD